MADGAAGGKAAGGKVGAGKETGARRPPPLTVPLRMSRKITSCRPCRPCRRAMPAAAFFGSGLSATIASVVISRPATEAASCSAVRTTLVGSMMPGLEHVAIFLGLGVVAELRIVGFAAACRRPPRRRRRRSRRSGAAAPGAPRTMSMPTRLVVVLAASASTSALARGSSATPPPATMPSSTAARVAFRASSTRSLRSFTSTSVAAADADHRDAAGQLGQPLLQLLAVVVRGGLLDLRLDLGDTGLDLVLVAGAVDDGGVSFSMPTFFARPSMSRVTFSSLMPRSSEIDLAAGQDGDVLQHGLAAVTEARAP
ncbi:MAG: hypothetical protein KatS3mg118_3561 [Paracoccaceae bacterium]|nr:MAG: hypothetical protein KatS3mg118_3561 [Paracoccaceae bacterium]